ncbi:TolC family protein [Aestuariibaculum sp. M13]|uniref:TolC family protein n=1 Tax=Aestuariibaculum sp. M13 TaxID=2967132 RepID=UPI002159EC49|nr:TolC family protein [Aestuariibaculum sp. M13]MCR8667465.1 TolC family protein [Aestuariibaculum sp. M13]
MSAQEKWSLEKCINYAKVHNIDIQKQQFQNEIKEEDIVIAKGNYFPDGNFNASQGFSLGNSFNVSTGVGQLESRFNSFSLSSSVNIFNGFSNRYKFQQAKLYAEKGNIDLEKLLLDLSLNISNKYLQVLFCKEILSVAKEQEAISQKEVSRLSNLFNVGLKSKSELLEMEATFSKDKKERLIAENNIRNSLIELQELLDVKPIDNFHIEPIDISGFKNDFKLVKEDDIYNKALKINPLIKSTQLSENINEKIISINKANFYPKFDFYYSYSSSYYHVQGREDVVFNQQTNQFENNGFLVQLDNNRTHYLGFALTVPLFNKFQTRSNIDKSKIELKIIKVELENQKKELKNKIGIAYNDVRTARATLEASESAFVFQEEVFSSAQNKYEEGIIPLHEFLECKSNYIKTQSGLINAKYEYLFKIKVLEYYYN